VPPAGAPAHGDHEAPLSVERWGGVFCWLHTNVAPSAAIAMTPPSAVGAGARAKSVHVVPPSAENAPRVAALNVRTIFAGAAAAKSMLVLVPSSGERRVAGAAPRSS